MLALPHLELPFVHHPPEPMSLVDRIALPESAEHYVMEAARERWINGEGADLEWEAAYTAGATMMDQQYRHERTQ
jgi:hypothetical protein